MARTQKNKVTCLQHLAMLAMDLHNAWAPLLTLLLPLLQATSAHLGLLKVRQGAATSQAAACL